MGRDTRYMSRQTQDPNKGKMHPVWRGIGCAFLIIIPVISFLAADFFITNQAHFPWLIIPSDMVVPYTKDPLILVRVFYTAILICALYLILTIITFFINRFFGPSRYGPYDVPLDKVERK